MIDYYKVLGLNKDATISEIEESYRFLAKKYHPDVCHESDKKFKEIQQAYEYLKKNTPKKIFFDKNVVDDIFDNILDNIFGDQKKYQNSSKVRILISLEESYNGCSKEIQFDKHEFCKNCQGTGGSSWNSCEKCHGKGFFSIGLACSKCEGKGSFIKEKCEKCNGNGFLIKEKKKLNINIPAGIKDSTQIRISEEGSGGGDLYVVVNVQKNKNYSLKNNDLYSEILVPYDVLLLGGIIDFDHFKNKIKVKIKPRTKTGSKIIIKNLGFPSLENEIKGNLILTVNLFLPKKINKKYKDILIELKNIENTII